MSKHDIFNKLHDKVIKTNLCTHCGTCVALSDNIEFIETNFGPKPVRAINNSIINNSLIYDACPGKGINYIELEKKIFDKNQNKDWLIGNYINSYIGYSLNSTIRNKAASGGIITALLVDLLDSKQIDGAIVVKKNKLKPWIFEPFIAYSKKEIIECSQSIYQPVPMNTILEQLNKKDGNFAFVGLPDQVLSIRYLQSSNHEDAKKIKIIIGPYVGTNMYLGSIKSFLRSNGVKDINEIKELNYRAGEWPGYLEIITKTNKVIKAEKFYYNYLIPFYITKSSLYSIDFTNELTDISVGDAWNPKYEKQGKGFSVIIARTKTGSNLLINAQNKKNIFLEKISINNLKSMHGHMLDFKKRGGFIRLKWKKIISGVDVNFGYRPINITLVRKVIEFFISFIFLIGSTSFIRKIIEFIPIRILGPTFNYIRIKWKSISKPSKRKGLNDLKFKIINKHE